MGLEPWPEGGMARTWMPAGPLEAGTLLSSSSEKSIGSKRGHRVSNGAVMGCSVKERLASPAYWFSMPNEIKITLFSLAFACVFAFAAVAILAS
jgi:hypothetical protein